MPASERAIWSLLTTVGLRCMPGPGRQGGLVAPHVHLARDIREESVLSNQVAKPGTGAAARCRSQEVALPPAGCMGIRSLRPQSSVTGPAASRGSSGLDSIQWGRRRAGREEGADGEGAGRACRSQDGGQFCAGRPEDQDRLPGDDHVREALEPARRGTAPPGGERLSPDVRRRCDTPSWRPRDGRAGLIRGMTNAPAQGTAHLQGRRRTGGTPLARPLAAERIAGAEGGAVRGGLRPVNP